MALPPCRSSSSFSLPKNSNSCKFQSPSPRSSEVTNPRAFGRGASANTSSDYPSRRRESISCPRECEEKENGRGPGFSQVHNRPSRSVSPSTRASLLPSISKGTKNFMSPTISTDSKINASPSKKILTERNNDQPLQSSVTYSDLRSSHSSLNSLSQTREETETRLRVKSDQKDCTRRRRESISCPRESKEKENWENPDQKQMQAKSLPTSRSMKNFMSPTISATSKVSASPRKKILTERNHDQPHISSVPSSNLRSSCNSVSNLSEGCETKSHDRRGSASKKKVAFDSMVRTIPPVVSDPLQESGGVKDEEPCQSSVTYSDLASSCSFVNTLSESLDDSQNISELRSDQNASESEELTLDLVPNAVPPVDENKNVEDGTVSNQASPNLKTSGPVLAPLDADPLNLTLPYDPKINYLALRAKFLHYRSSQGNTECCNGEIGGNPLDDSFSDNEGTEQIESNALPKELEDFSSEEILTKKETNPASPEICKELIGVKEAAWGNFLMRRPKWIFSIFVILVACSVMMGSNPQIRSYSINKDSGFTVVSVAIAARNLTPAVSSPGEHLVPRSSDLFLYSSRFISNHGNGCKVGYFCGHNLTALDETQCLKKDKVYRGSINDRSYMRASIKNFEQNAQTEKEEPERNENWESGSEIYDGIAGDETGDDGWENEASVADEIFDKAQESGDGSEILDEQVYEQEYEILDAESGVFRVEEKVGDEIEFDPAQLETKVQVVDILNDKNEIPRTTEIEFQQTREILDGPESEREYESDVFTVEEKIREDLDPAQSQSTVQMVINSMNEKYEIVTTAEIEVLQSIESPKMDDTHSVYPKSLETDSIDMPVPGLMKCSFLTLSLVVAITTFVCMKRKSYMNVMTLEEQDQQQIQPFIVKSRGFNSVSANHLEELDSNGVSCSSAMSSYQEDSFDSRRMKIGTGEAQSHEKKSRKSFRREPLASSMSNVSASSVSQSYGSFTTYSVTPNKHRNGDEELVVTPMRRSSRLRK